MKAEYDALVVGGGPAGSSAAILLARRGWSVLVVERRPFPRRKVCGEYLSATNFPLLRRLGVAEAFHERAGPDVRRVGLFAGKSTLTADLPAVANGPIWGRAVGREHLDTLLLRQAAQAGADVLQPWALANLVREGPVFRGWAACRTTGATRQVTARLVVAAHGSWEVGPLPTQTGKTAARGCDLFGFKAHFASGNLPDGLMPLLAFPGGYGGMVHTDAGRLSLSCCVRRDRLGRLRTRTGATAGAEVGAYVAAACRGVAEALRGAVREGDWLSAGPIRPGMRLRFPAGVFPVGNAAGEAHPVVAEGISMALQSAWLLAGCLQAWRDQGGRAAALPAVGAAYARQWRRHFGPRLRTSSLVARWAMSPAAVALSLPLVRCFPRLLTWGARASGKTHRVVSFHSAHPSCADNPV